MSVYYTYQFINIYLFTHQFIYANEQPDEEINRMWCGKVLSIGASVPVELGYATQPAHKCIANLEVLRIP